MNNEIVVRQTTEHGFKEMKLAAFHTLDGFEGVVVVDMKKRRASIYESNEAYQAFRDGAPLQVVQEEKPKAPQDDTIRVPVEIEGVKFNWSQGPSSQKMELLRSEDNHRFGLIEVERRNKNVRGEYELHVNARCTVGNHTGFTKYPAVQIGDAVQMVERNVEHFLQSQRRFKERRQEESGVLSDYLNERKEAGYNRIIQ